MRFILLGALGGLLPDVIRFVAWARSTEEPNVHIAAPVVALRIVGLLGQSAFGALAVFLLGSATELQAAAIGFAGPEFLTRVLAAAVPGTSDQAELEMIPEGQSAGGQILELVRWWGL